VVSLAWAMGESTNDAPNAGFSTNWHVWSWA
jgi:hypothetical protein